MRILLLTMHVIAAAAWLGGNLSQLIMTPMFERRGAEATAAWFEGCAKMAKNYYSAAAVTIMITGVLLLVGIDSPWGFEDAFVSFGFLAVIIATARGMIWFIPKAEAAAEGYATGNIEPAKRAARIIRIGAILDTGLVLFTVFSMVAKLGA